MNVEPGSEGCATDPAWVFCAQATRKPLLGLRVRVPVLRDQEEQPVQIAERV